MIDEDGLGYADVGEEVDWGAAPDAEGVNPAHQEAGKANKPGVCFSPLRVTGTAHPRNAGAQHHHLLPFFQAAPAWAASARRRQSLCQAHGPACRK